MWHTLHDLSWEKRKGVPGIMYGVEYLLLLSKIPCGTSRAVYRARALQLRCIRTYLALVPGTRYASKGIRNGDTNGYQVPGRL